MTDHHQQPDARSAEAYAALIHIQAGDWDDYALRLYAAVTLRLRQPEVRQRWTSGLLPRAVADD